MLDYEIIFKVITVIATEPYGIKAVDFNVFRHFSEIR